MDMHTLLVLTPVLVGLGGLAGFLAGLLGVGGGIVLVPGLFYIMTALGYPPDHMMHLAVGTSLAIIIPTGMSSVRAHYKRGAVRVDLLRMIGVGIVIGVAAGTVIASHISGESLKLIFAVALLFLAGVMLVNPSRFALADHVPGQPWPGLMGVVIGGLSTLMGIGGATISVPYMTLCRVPIHQAVGTASALGLIISIPAAVGFGIIGWGQDHLPPFSIGYISLLAFALIVPCSVLAAPLGAHVAHNVSVVRLRAVFAVFLVIVSLKMLYSAVYG